MTAGRLPIPSGEPVLPERRRRLSRREFAQLMLDQSGRCWHCGEKLMAEGIVDEHLVPLEQGGSNQLANRALFCWSCARHKTEKDIAATNRGRRIRGEAGQKKRRDRRRQGLPERPTFATNRDGKWKKKIGGRVVRRSKEELRRLGRRKPPAIRHAD